MILVHPLFGDGGPMAARASELEMYDISVDEAMRLNAEWHSLLPDTERGNLHRNRERAFYALALNNVYYAVAISTSPIAGNRLPPDRIELRRLAIADYAPRNTATRFMGMMRRDLKKKFPHIRKAISYQATKYHLGTIYKADNWEPVTSSGIGGWSRDTPGRKRTPTQAQDSVKVRWERYL